MEKFNFRYNKIDENGSVKLITEICKLKEIIELHFNLGYVKYLVNKGLINLKNGINLKAK